MSADVHVLVPVKRLDDAKSRLAGVLSLDERRELMLEMLEDVVTAVRASAVGPVTLVSPEPLEVDGASRFDDRGLPWNDALAAAIGEVVAEPVVAIVAGDLPRLSAADVLELVAATPERGLAIGRAKDGGTNAVAMRPPGIVATSFGEPGSALVHVEAGRRAGVEAVLVDREGLAFDVDTAEDLALWH